jgi:uncharacterized peroxidase-related enzyme
MSGFNMIEPDEANDKTKELFDQIHEHLGIVPNMAKAMANSPALLESYHTMNTTLGQGILSPRLRVQIALTVAETHQCRYCVSVHTEFAQQIGLTELEILEARMAISVDPKEDVVLKFARGILDYQNNVAEEELWYVRDAGYNDEEIAEIIGNVALNFLTSHFNFLANTELDFPPVELRNVHLLKKVRW